MERELNTLISLRLDARQSAAKAITKRKKTVLHTAMASTRELQATQDLDEIVAQMKKADHLGAYIYKLIRQLDG